MTDRYERFKAWVNGETLEDGTIDYHGKKSYERFEKYEDSMKAKRLREKALEKERD